MRRLVTFAMLLGALAPCSAESQNATSPPASAEVQSIAEHYIETLPKSTSPQRIKQAHDAFIWSFLDGFTDSEGAIWSSDNARTQGFEAGQTYRHQNPKELSHIMSGFGYKPIRLRGIWQTGPELSKFVPANNPNDRWWLSILGNSPAAKSHFSPEQCQNVQVSGFLSPRGQYGHMGGFAREVYVNTISCVRPKSSHGPTSPISVA